MASRPDQTVKRSRRPTTRSAASAPGLPAWRRDAACRDEDITVFFPEGTTPDVNQMIKKARVLCARCPVQPECLRWAIDTRQDWGVWGGRTRNERLAQRRHEQRTAGRRPMATAS